MTYVLIIGSICCGWALLSVLGGERQRRFRQTDAEQAAAAAAAEAIAAAARREAGK